jgi:sugar lactone lactonase YvrE
VAPDGTVYIADTWNNRIRRIDPRTGTIHAFAGTGKGGYAGDGGPAIDAQFGGIYCLAFNADFDKLYLADLDKHSQTRSPFASVRDAAKRVSAARQPWSRAPSA